MRSAIEEIRKLRSGDGLIFDRKNSNPYCLTVCEGNGRKTAYCFSTPVYSRRTGRLLDRSFYPDGSLWRTEGSGVCITAGRKILLEEEGGSCGLLLPDELSAGSAEELWYGRARLAPTYNGLAFRVPCRAGEPYEIKLLCSRPFMNLRTNDRSFALMADEFRPFAVLSCIGTLDERGGMTAPCTVGYEKLSDTAYLLTVRHASPWGSQLLFEFNLHEPKLFQDTTVESRNPALNNVFGAAAFLGNTEAYGEQRLYSRPDLTRLPALRDKFIEKIILRLPEYGGGGELAALSAASRFCSFGSSWNNRIPEAREAALSWREGGFQNLDLTEFLTDGTGLLRQPEGLILKRLDSAGFTAVATGDSCLCPQILEVRFRAE